MACGGLRFVHRTEGVGALVPMCKGEFVKWFSADCPEYIRVALRPQSLRFVACSFNVRAELFFLVVLCCSCAEVFQRGPLNSNGTPT